MRSGTILADLDLPCENFDNVVVDYNKDYDELTLSLFNGGHYQCEVCLNFVNRTICEDFTNID